MGEKGHKTEQRLLPFTPLVQRTVNAAPEKRPVKLETEHGSVHVHVHMYLYPTGLDFGACDVQ